MASDPVTTPEQKAAAEMAKFSGYASKDGEPIKGSSPAANMTADETAHAAVEDAAAKTAAAAAGADDAPVKAKVATPADRAKAAIAAARGDAPAVAEAAADAVDEAVDDEAAEAGEVEEAEEAPAPVAARPKETAQARINQAIAKQRAAEREAGDLKRQVEALLAGPRPAPAPAVAATPGAEVLPPGLGAKPDPEKYEFKAFDAQYAADLQGWTVKKTLLEHDAANAGANQNAQRAQEVARVNGKINEMSEAALEKYPDFDQVVVQAGREGKWALSNQLGELILNSDHGADISYALATDPSEAARVFRLPVMEQAAYFGRLEAHFGGTQSPQTPARPVVKPSKAPTPPARQARGAGGNPAPVSADTTDFAAFERVAQRKG